MDYQLHGQGLTMRAGNYPGLTVMNHFMMRKDMKAPTIPVAFGASVQQKALHGSGARPRRSKTSGMYKRYRKPSGASKKGRKSARRRR